MHTTIIRAFLIVSGLLIALYSAPFFAFLGLVLFFLGITGDSIQPLFFPEVHGKTRNRRRELKKITLKQSPGKREISRTKRGVWAQPEWVVTTLLVRRILLWTAAGGIIFFTTVAFHELGRIFIVKDTSRFVAIVENLGGPWDLFAYLLIALVLGFFFGYLLHQFYYFVTSIVSFPIRFSKPDRVYAYLYELKNNYRVNLSRFDIDGKGLRNTSNDYVRLPFWALLSPSIYYFKPTRINDFVHASKANWRIFEGIWYELIPSDRFEAVEILARFKEDNYVFSAVARVALLIGWVLFVSYEWILVQNGQLLTLHFQTMVQQSAVLTVGLLVILLHISSLLSDNMIAFKYANMRGAIENRFRRSGRAKKDPLFQN